jgi:hypothetical protein
MAIAYLGPSTTNVNNRLVVLTTLAKSDKKANAKTGQMLQTYFLLADHDPNEAFKAAYKQENAIAQTVCGGCPHLYDGTCYVLWFHGPLSTWKKFQRGGHAKEAIPTTFPVRLGSAGNPNSAPYEVSEMLVQNAPSWTGYVHQWLTCDQRFKKLTMASCDSKAEAKTAQALGWRTFRVAEIGDDELLPGEVICPATQKKWDGTPKTDCATCGLCSGTDGRGKCNIVVTAHGKAKTKFSSHEGV